MDNTDTKQRILESAMSLFSEFGYNGVSMRDISSNVGISPPALYNHFSNKDDLYREAIAKAFEGKFAQLLDAIENGESSLQCLYNAISILTSSLQQDRSFHVLMQREMLDADQARMTFLSHFIFKRVQQPFHQLFSQLKPGCDATLLTDLVFGMATKHFDLKPARPFLTGDAACERDASAVADQILAILQPYFDSSSNEDL